jgi:protein phosphatase
MQFESFGITDKGIVRDHNEDSLLANDTDGLFLVADGMGGLSKGDIASKIAVETIEHFIQDSRLEDITWPIKPLQEYSLEENRLLAAISLANWNIFNEALKDPVNRGMGTTLVGFLVDGDQLVIANIGDSRMYLIKENRIQQITDDHSLVMEEVRKGTMTLEEARVHPHKHVINRALGISETTQADISTMTLESTDLYLICSDGLTNMLTDEELFSLARANAENGLKTTAEKLIEAAKRNGGKDNITVVLVSFHE